MPNTVEGSTRNRETERVLLDVIKTLQDGQKGFADIGEHLKDEQVKRYFLAESLKRANFRAELENELHRAGMADIEESGSVAGALHRAWGDLKSNGISNCTATCYDTRFRSSRALLRNW